ncbi:HAD domain-containing protein [Duganella violaceipulchra]|uniref:Uncharacterized protein n=1 Tax=Duganella violaceipulchra TaxID=2849652 RepID=A0AA41L8E4_9BURK|nr:HAD domain-containing protein [Duganella violaceicalia]MBV6322150.1 hypothetical protein [Duganella violaceicalia]MCP2011296.1 hypothetical protein [Duganella violaceicalia]
MEDLSVQDASTAADLVVYLDFDGVLHDDAVYWSKRDGIHIRMPGRTLFEWSHVLEQLLTPYPMVRIVLSTSWVRVKNFEFAKKQLPIGLQARVVGATFHRREMRTWQFDNMSRGAQVLADVQRRQPAAWFALDNDDHDWPVAYRDHLVKTEDRLGLSDPQVQKDIQARLASLSAL